MCKEFPNELNSRFSPRTVRLWFEKEVYSHEQLLTEGIKQYDKKVFKLLDGIMNDKDFFEYFYLLKAGHSSHSSKINKLAKYCYYAELESNKHVYPMLKRLFNDFYNKLDDLEKYITPHSFTRNGNPDMIEVMPYEHRKHMSHKLLNEYVNKFMELVDIAEKAYLKYRAAIRDNLYI